MKNLKILVVALLVSLSLVIFSACGHPKCESTCPICHLCTDDNCQLHTDASQHCQGHSAVEQVAVTSILQNNVAFQNMNDSAANIIDNEIQEAVAKQHNVDKSAVEIVNVDFDDDYETATVLAKVDDKKVVVDQYETDAVAEYRDSDAEYLVLSEAGYKADDKVAKEKQSEVDAKFTAAVNAILAKLSNLSEEATLVKANEIFSEYASDEVIPGFDGIFGCDEFFLSGVREDGTVVAFTYTKGSSNDPLRLQGYQDHVLKVEGRENMTNAEIMAQIKAGNFTKETRTIDPSKTYTAPALEEKPVVETTTVGEIYDANFANVDFSAKLEEAFQNICSRRFPSSMTTEPMFYAQDGETVSLYVNVNDGQDLLYKLTFNSSFDITELDKLDKSEILTKAGLTAATEVEKTNSETTKNKIAAVVEEINCNIDVIANLKNSQITRDGIINNTEDNIDFKAFGEKLCPDKEVIATYVGAQTGKTNDSAHEFNTGYYTQFKVVVVYLENEEVVVENKLIYAPYYNDSTNESIYNSLLNGEENKNYKIASNEKETIKNATIAKQKESASAAAEYEFYFDGLDEESERIGVEAVKEYLNGMER